MTKPIDRMYKQFGKEHGYKCGACCNFVKGAYHDKCLQKCERYGMSHSMATDWLQKFPACGKLNVPLEKGEKPLKDYVQDRKPRTEPEGQME